MLDNCQFGRLLCFLLVLLATSVNTLVKASGGGGGTPEINLGVSLSKFIAALQHKDGSTSAKVEDIVSDLRDSIQPGAKWSQVGKVAGLDYNVSAFHCMCTACPVHFCAFSFSYKEIM